MDKATYALLSGKINNITENVEQIVDDWLEDNVDPDSGYVLDRTLSMENAAAPADLVGDLKSAVGNVEKSAFDFVKKPVDAIAAGWRLNESDGLCSQNSGYKIIKFKVTVGDIVKVSSDDRFQFQTIASVPSSGTSNRVGNTYGTGQYLLEVPATATYLIISTPTSGTGYAYSLNLKSSEEKVMLVGNAGGLWKQGGLNTNNASATTSTYKTRLGGSLKDNWIQKIECDDGYGFVAFGYKKTDGTYEGIYQPNGTYVKSSTGTGFEWYTSLDISLLDGRSYNIMAHHIVSGSEVAITPAEAAQHFRFYGYSKISDKEIAEYASENKKIINQMVVFETGGLNSAGGDYDNGGSAYNAATKRSSYIIPDCDSGEIVYFESTNKDIGVRVLVYDQSGTFVSISQWDNAQQAIVYSTGSKYKVVLQNPTYSTASGTLTAEEALNIFRVYIKEVAESPIALTPSKRQFCVMSHNVGQWCNGSGSVATYDVRDNYNDLHKEIIKRNCPDILCIQEYTDKIALLGNYYDGFYEANSANNNIYTGKCIASNYKQSDGTLVLYENQASSAESDPKCNYAYSYVWINGRKICVINTHLVANDTSTAKLQMAELMAFAETQEYVIVCLDSNLDCNTVTDQNYIDSFKPWVDAGYNMANYSDWGFMVTCYNTLSNDAAIDNIITSGNIEIKYACVDQQKKDAALDSKIDHLPIIAYIAFAEDDANDPFIVTLTPTAEDFSGTMDKTPAEIYEAYSAGKRIRAKILGVYGATDTYLYADAIYYGSFEGASPNVEVHFMFSFLYGETNLLVDVCTDIYSETYTTTIYPLTPMS